MIMYTVADEHMIADTEIAQVIAFICGVIVILLMIMGLASTEWLMALGWRQGLFAHCIEEGAPTPLPFNIVDPPGCYQARDVGYIRAAAALCVVCLLADIAATILTGLGLRCQDHSDKHKYYRFAVFCMGVALISLLIALVIYPVCFAAELNFGNRTMWEFGWAYGVGWGAAIFLFGGGVLLLCDKESEEVYYKERKIVREDVATGAVATGNNSLGHNSNNSHHMPHHHVVSGSSIGMGGSSMIQQQQQQQQQQHHLHGMRSGTQLA